MARPEVDDEIIEMAHEICDQAVTVPLPADELSTNQKLRIVVLAAYETLEEDDRKNAVDAQYDYDTVEIPEDRSHLEPGDGG